MSVCLSVLINYNYWTSWPILMKLCMQQYAMKYSRVSNKRVYTRTCILAKFPLYTALLDTYTTPCKSKTWWANFFDKLKKLKLLHKNDAQDIEQEQNEHKTYENHNSFAHWIWCLRSPMVRDAIWDGKQMQHNRIIPMVYVNVASVWPGVMSGVMSGVRFW